MSAHPITSTRRRLFARADRDASGFVGAAGKSPFERGAAPLGFEPRITPPEGVNLPEKMQRYCPRRSAGNGIINSFVYTVTSRDVPRRAIITAGVRSPDATFSGLRCVILEPPIIYEYETYTFPELLCCGDVGRIGGHGRAAWWQPFYGDVPARRAARRLQRDAPNG